jgi:hypothetical protein
MMTRTQINWWAGRMPVLMSLAALMLVLVVVTTGWERHLHDEGAAAHLFQLLIVAQVPVVALFLATADRRDPLRLFPLLAAQTAAVLVALGSVALFRL